MSTPDSPPGEQERPAADESVTAPTESGMSGIARQTVVYGVGMVLGKSLSVLMLPVYTRFLTPGDYGVMELISMALDVVMIVAGSRLLDGIYRFYHKANSADQRNEVVATAFGLLEASFAALGFATLFAAPWLSRLIFGTGEHAALIRVAAATVAITPLVTVPLAYYRMRDRAGIVVSSNLSKLVVGAALNVVLLFMGWGIMAMFVGGLVTTLLVGVALTVSMFREVGLGFSRGAARDLYRYGLPLVMTNVATFAFTFGDRFFLQSAGGETVVGLYMMAYQFGFLLMMVGYSPFMNVWNPRRFKIAEREDRGDRDALYARGFIYLNVIMLTVAAGMVLFIGDFFRIMTTPPFYPAAQFVPVIIVAYVLQAWGSAQEIGILVTERTSYITYANWIAAAVAIVGYALLIPRYLAWGAAWTTLLTFLVRYILIFGWSQRFWRIEYEWVPVFKLLGLATCVGAGGMALPEMRLLPSLGVRTAIFAAFLAAVWVSGILEPNDKDALRARARRVRDSIWRRVSSSA